MPRGVRRETIAGDYVPPLSPLEIGEQESIDPVEQIRADKLEHERFMQEPVTIYLSEASDDNATPAVEVSVNGRRVILPRGQNVTVKRMYVERLARAKRTAISQNLDPSLREEVNRVQRREILDYPFSVIHDSDRGREWLKNIMAQRQ